MALLQNVIQRGTHAARPAAGSAGLLYFESDTCQLFRDSGSAWQLDDTSLIFTAKGDLLVATGSAAIARLGVGTDGQVLTADSSQTGGIKWGAAGAGSGGALTQISAQTLGSSAASVTFSSIAGTYSNLLLCYQARDTSGNTGGDNLQLQFNADTAGHYDYVVDYTAGSSASATQAQAQTSMVLGHVAGGGNAANFASGGSIMIPNYAGTTFYKVAVGSTLSYNGTSAGSNLALLWDGGWRSTSAITQIVLAPSAGSFATGSSFVLYGLS